MATLDATTGFGSLLAENSNKVKVTTITRTLTAAESVTLTSTGVVQMVDIPAGYLLLGGTFTVDTAGTATCNASIGLTGGDVDGFMAAADMDSEATSALLGALVVAGGAYFGSADTLDLLFDTAAPGALKYTLRLVGVQTI